LSWLLSGAFWWTIYLSGALIVAHLVMRNSGQLQLAYQDDFQGGAGMGGAGGFYQQPQILMA